MNFFGFGLSFYLFPSSVVESGIQDEKNRIRDNYPESATLKEM
jgi:hypothetical protein